MEGDKSARLYQQKSANVQHNYGKNLLNHVNIEEGNVVLEIGCGCGDVAAMLSKMVGSTGKVIAIDPDMNRIKFAKKQHDNNENILFVPCKSIHFPIHQQPYDVCISNAVLHWISTEEKVITFRRIISSLKPGGIFVGNISFNRSVNMLRATSLLKPEEQEEIKHFYYRENSEILQTMLVEAGFEVLKFNYRYEESNLGSVMNFLSWITGTYSGRFDFKSAYTHSKIEFLTYENGDVKHTSEGALFVVKKPE